MGDVFDFPDEDNSDNEQPKLEKGDSSSAVLSSSSIGSSSGVMMTSAPKIARPPLEDENHNNEKKVQFSLSSEERQESSQSSSNASSAIGSSVAAGASQASSSSSVSSSASWGAGLSSRRMKMRQMLKLKEVPSKQDGDDSSLSLASIKEQTDEAADNASIASSVSSSARGGPRASQQRRVRRHYGSASSASRGSSSVASSSRASRGEMSPSTVSIRGAGTSVVAVQDAGSYRMLYDDLSYLCTSISACGNIISAAQILCDLALLLSNRKTRGILFSTHGTEALESVLDALTSHGGGVGEMAAMMRGRSDLVEVDKQDDFGVHAKTDASAGTLNAPESSKNKFTPRTRTGRLKQASQTQGDAPLPNFDTTLLQLPSLGALHFISWDCTTHEQNTSSPSAAAACKVRASVLQNAQVMRLLCGWILGDPIVQSTIQGRERQEKQLGAAAGSAEKNVTKKESDSSTTVEPEAGSASKEGDQEGPAPNRLDPTLMGRRNRRKKRRLQLESRPTPLDSIPEGEEAADPFAFSADSPKKVLARPSSSASPGDSSTGARSQRSGARDDASLSTVDTNASSRLEDKICRLKGLLGTTTQQTEDVMKVPPNHTCTVQLEGYDELDDGLPHASAMALDALNRIVSGKEGDDVSCLESEVAAQTQRNRPANEEEELRNNPLLITNTRLRESGALVILARAMIETLIAVLQLIQSATTDQPPCLSCLEHLQRRTSTLASLIDGACCLTEENRTELCSQESGSLVGSLLLLLDTVSDHLVAEDSSPPAPETIALHDIGLVALRTLTSLTHENAKAGEQLMRSYRRKVSDDAEGRGSMFRPGARILVGLLLRAASAQAARASSTLDAQTATDESKADHHHVTFDMVVFCLNTLTNAINAKGLRDALAENTASEGKSFVQWLAAWVVEQTNGFREAILSASFGVNNNNNNGQVATDPGRGLEKHEEEPLVLAGNACILLVCLMKSSETAAPLRDVILAELPENGLVFIQNTLRAFCNFYHYSLGDLSVAIVGPVAELITDLDSMINSSY